MRKHLPVLLLCLVVVQAMGQSSRKVSIFLSGQFSLTTYTGAADNNAKGPGGGIQTFINMKSKFKPLVDLSVDMLIDDTKVYNLENEGKVLVDGTLVNLFAGGSYHPNQNLFFSLTGGASLLDGRTMLGVKGSFGFYFSKTQRWMGRVSFTNVFNHEPVTKGDMGMVSAGIGVRLF